MFWCFAIRRLPHSDEGGGRVGAQLVTGDGPRVVFVGAVFGNGQVLLNIVTSVTPEGQIQSNSILHSSNASTARQTLEPVARSN